MLLGSRLKVNDIKPDQGHLDIDKIEHFIDLRNTPADFFHKIIQNGHKSGPRLRKMSDRAEHVFQ